MNFYPAIDIKDGQFIRLKKGELNHMTIYGDNPTQKAEEFLNQGAKWIHVVDIDGAFKGISKNMDAIFKIKKTTKCKIQVGGGIRGIKTVEKYIENGLDRIVLGTKALNEPKFIKEICKMFPERIAIGLDTRNGFVATEGWKKDSEVHFREIVKIYEDSGVSAIVFPDINKDGLMTGVNFDLLTELLSITKINIIASGGISSLEDLKKIKEIQTKNLIGVISGKAVYENKFTVSDAIRIIET